MLLNIVPGGCPWNKKIYKPQSLIASEGYKNSTLKNLLHPAKGADIVL